MYLFVSRLSNPKLSIYFYMENDFDFHLTRKSHQYLHKYEYNTQHTYMWIHILCNRCLVLVQLLLCRHIYSYKDTFEKKKKTEVPADVESSFKEALNKLDLIVNSETFVLLPNPVAAPAAPAQAPPSPPALAPPAAPPAQAAPAAQAAQAPAEPPAPVGGKKKRNYKKNKN